MELTFSREAARAREMGAPLLALESTLITHGLPHPENAVTGRRLETVAREAGVTPATVALLGGDPRIGLTPEQLDYLAALSAPRKCSLRDLAIAMALRESGGTTVAATMHLAHLAGIRIFSTGGIGGVHRGHPWDVSADLTALGSIPITVVCAGAKAILDLPLTLEVLETQGVTIVGYQTDTFPAFYCRSSGLPVDVRCDSVAEVVKIIRARDDARLRQAILVVTPVPAADALSEAEAEAAIEQALAEADRDGVTGKRVTPFLLAKVSALTAEKSMTANLSLLENNVRLGAALATELNRRA